MLSNNNEKKIGSKYLYFIRIHFFFTNKTVLKIGITKNFRQRMGNFLFSNDQKYVKYIEPIRVMKGSIEKIENMEKYIIDKYSIKANYNRKENNVYEDLKFIMPDGKSEVILDTDQNIKNVLEETKDLYNDTTASDIIDLSFKLHMGEKDIRLNEILEDFKVLQKNNTLKRELFSLLTKANSIYTYKDMKRIYRKYFFTKYNDEYRIYFVTKYSEKFFTVSRIDEKGAEILEQLLEDISTNKIKKNIIQK